VGWSAASGIVPAFVNVHRFLVAEQDEKWTRRPSGLFRRLSALPFPIDFPGEVTLCGSGGYRACPLAGGCLAGARVRDRDSFHDVHPANPFHGADDGRWLLPVVAAEVAAVSGALLIPHLTDPHMQMVIMFASYVLWACSVPLALNILVILAAARHP
jgi:hypothetical protein